MSKVRSGSALKSAQSKRQFVKEFHSAIKPAEFVRSIDHMNFKQARRQRGPIYKVLSKELYEENCTIAADYFNCLVLKEQRLHTNNLTRVLVKDYPELLFKLHENVMLAEKAGKLKQSGGTLACLRILHQTLKLLDNQTKDLDWLRKDLHVLFIDIVEKYAKKDSSCNEVKAHLLCSYAIFLSTQTDDFEKCVEYFKKSLELCRGENWPPEDNKDRHNFATLHEFVAINCVRKMKNYALSFFYTNPEYGTEMVKNAIVILSEVDHPSEQSIENRVLYCECLVLQAALLVEQKKYIECLKHINNVMDRIDPIMGEDYMRLMCEIYLIKGLCFVDLEEFSSAMTMFKKSLFISKTRDLPLLKARALLRVGELYSKHPNGKSRAIKAYEESKYIFNQLKNNFHKRRAVYGVARILAQDVFPSFFKVLQKSSHDICGLYTLRKWKYLKVAPWNIQRRESIDSIMTLGISNSYIYLVDQYKNMLSNHKVGRTTEFINEMLLLPYKVETETKAEVHGSDLIDKDCVLNED